MGRKRKYDTRPITDFVFEGTLSEKDPIIDWRAYFKAHPMDGSKKDRDDGNPILEEIAQNEDNFAHGKIEFPYKPIVKRLVDMQEETRRVRDMSYAPSYYRSKKAEMSEEEYDKMIQEWERLFRQDLISDLAELYIWGDKKPDLFRQVSFPANNTGKLGSPVRVPTWMWAAPTFAEEEFHFDRIQMVALTHVIYFTLTGHDTGYIEKSGHIETWCRCTVEDAHKALTTLCSNGLIYFKFLPDMLVGEAARNLGWFADVPYIQKVLSNYGRRIDK